MQSASKKIRNTNITVQYDAAVDTRSPAYLLSQIRPDDQGEVHWAVKQRPLQNMIHPAEAFNEGIKTLRPAVMFNTYDEGKAKTRRLHNQREQQKRTVAYRAKAVKASEALKALGDRKKLVVRDTVDEFESDPVLKRLPGRKIGKSASEKAEDYLKMKDKKSSKRKANKQSKKSAKTAIGKSL